MTCKRAECRSSATISHLVTYQRWILPQRHRKRHSKQASQAPQEERSGQPVRRWLRRRQPRQRSYLRRKARDNHTCRCFMEEGTVLANRLVRGRARESIAPSCITEWPPGINYTTRRVRALRHARQSATGKDGLLYVMMHAASTRLAWEEANTETGNGASWGRTDGWFVTTPVPVSGHECTPRHLSLMLLVV